MPTSIPAQPLYVPVIDYQQHPEASIWVLPKSATLSSSGDNWHFEVQRQPAHHTGEHRHSMHLVTMVTSRTLINQSIDGQLQRNLVGQNNAFILPAGYRAFSFPYKFISEPARTVGAELLINFLVLPYSLLPTPLMLMVFTVRTSL